MADPVAIVSVVSGATVAVAVPFINATLERQRLRWQSNQSRLDELRGIVDSSLAEVVRVHDLVWDLAQSAASAEPGPTVEQLSAELTQAYGAVKTYSTRIGLRLGSDDVVALAHVRLESIVANVEVVAAQWAQAGRRPGAEELWSARNELGLAIGEFQDAVRDLIGPIRERRSHG